MTDNGPSAIIHVPELSMQLGSLMELLNNTYNLNLINPATFVKKISQMKTLEEIKAEIAKEIGEPNGFDFQFEEEVQVGDYVTAKALYSDLIDRYIKQFMQPDELDNDNSADGEEKFGRHGKTDNNTQTTEEIIESKFITSDFFKKYFGEKTDYEFDNDDIADTDMERMPIRTPIVILTINESESEEAAHAVSSNYEAFRKEAERAAKKCGLRLRDVTTLSDNDQVVVFNFFDDNANDEPEYEDGGDPPEDEFYVISWETEDDYRRGEEKEITVHGQAEAIRMAENLVNGHYDKRKFYAAQVNDQHGEIAWSSMEEIYENGSIAEGSLIALDAPAISTKPGNTVTYRWVVDVAVPALKSILRVERWATGMQEWVPVQGQWYMGTLLGAPGFYGGQPVTSDIISADFGSGSEFSGLQAALKEAQQLIGPEKFAHGGVAGGKTRKREWFKGAVEEKAPYNLNGWSKTKSAAARRRAALSSRPANSSKRKRYVSVGRALQALANVTTDPRTKALAKMDADHFFLEAKKFEDGGDSNDQTPDYENAVDDLVNYEAVFDDEMAQWLHESYGFTMDQAKALADHQDKFANEWCFKMTVDDQIAKAKEIVADVPATSVE